MQGTKSETVQTFVLVMNNYMDRVKRIWYLSPMRAAKVQASLNHTVSYKQWVKRNLQTESQIPGPSEWLGMRS